MWKCGASVRNCDVEVWESVGERGKNNPVIVYVTIRWYVDMGTECGNIYNKSQNIWTAPFPQSPVLGVHGCETSGRHV